MTITSTIARNVLKDEFTVNVFTTGDQVTPDVLGLANNGFVVSYRNVSTGLVGLDFYDSSFNHVGSTQFPQNPGSAAGQPSLTLLENGNVLVIWDENTGANPGPQGAIYTPTGTPVSGLLTFGWLSPNPNTVSDPQVAALTGGGFAIVSTLSIGGLSGDDVFLTICDAAGNVVTGSAVSATSGVLKSGNQNDASISALPDGRFVVTWTDSGGMTPAVLMQLFNADGTSGSGGGSVLDGVDSNTSSHVVAYKNGWAITWVDTSWAESGGTGAGLSFKTFFNDGLLGGGSPITGHINTSSAGDESDPDIAVLSNGYVLVTWTYPTGAGNHDVRGRLYSAGGVGATTVDGSASEFTITASPTDDTLSAIGTMGSGKLVSVWQDAFSDGSGGRIGAKIDQFVRTSIGDGTNETFVSDGLADIFTGGGGDNRYVFAPGGGADTITDFVAGIGVIDKIDLRAFTEIHDMSDLLIAGSVGFTSIKFRDLDGVTLTNQTNSVIAGDFIFAPFLKNDFNADGPSDILWRNDNGAVSIWDSGTLAGAHVVSNAGVVPNSWHISGKGDFDGNGKGDILWRNDNGAVSIWDNGTLAGAHVVANAGVVPNSWHIEGTGDFDGNGKADILWRNDDGAVSIWDNGALGGAHVVSGSGVVANTWHIAGVGDFDGNQKSDILWRNDNGTVSVWNDGTLAGANVISFDPLPDAWHIAGVGDFDGNAKSDILWRHDNGTVSIWIDAYVGYAHVISGAGVVPNSWHISDTGDYDSNSKADILWRNDNGAVSIWDNGTLAGAHVIANAGVVPNDWHIA